MPEFTVSQLLDQTRQVADQLRALFDETTLPRDMGPYETREFGEALRSLVRQCDEFLRLVDPGAPVAEHTVRLYQVLRNNVVDLRRLFPGGRAPEPVLEAVRAAKALVELAEQVAARPASAEPEPAEPRPVKVTRNMLHDLVGRRLGGVDVGGGAYAAPAYDQMGIAYDLGDRYGLIGAAVTRTLDDVPDAEFAAVAERHRLVDWPDGVRMTRAAREEAKRRPR